jgi:NADH-quinone oxidoreductase subunit J
MNLNADTEPQKSWLVQLAGVVSGGILFLVIIAAISKANLLGMISPEVSNIGLIKVLGMVLFKEYVLPFEISSVLFLSAMLGAIVIGKKDME